MTAKLFYISALLILGTTTYAQRSSQFISTDNAPNTICLAGTNHVADIVVDPQDHTGVLLAVKALQTDMELVTGKRPNTTNQQGESENTVIVIGTLGHSKHIDDLIAKGIIDKNQLQGKHEKYIIQTIDAATPNTPHTLVIAGSDMRGTIYGIYELSEQIGVSPWYYWADVPVKQSPLLYATKGTYTAGEPAVKYRGIFLNDEAPALSGWSKHTFGGFNHQFYQKVFELILRLRGNFLWPAMWGSAFFDDDPENGQLAHDMGIVISTSHHEPMGRAHDEWRRYGKGKWDYSNNPKALADFWRAGMERMKNYETIVTLAMRGDGDEPMSEDSNIKLLEKIVKDQRTIIGQVTGKKPVKRHKYGHCTKKYKITTTRECECPMT
jgi:hypothetical protein